MKIKIGTLYRSIFKNFGQSYEEVIFAVVDADYEHHKGYYEFKIKAISPSYFHTTLGKVSDTIWIKGSELASCEALPKSHPAWLLYGK